LEVHCSFTANRTVPPESQNQVSKVLGFVLWWGKAPTPCLESDAFSSVPSLVFSSSRFLVFKSDAFSNVYLILCRSVNTCIRQNYNGAYGKSTFYFGVKGQRSKNSNTRLGVMKLKRRDRQIGGLFLHNTHVGHDPRGIAGVVARVEYLKRLCIPSLCLE